MMNLPPDREIVALVPEYTDEGDSVRVLFADGTETRRAVSMKTLMKGLAERRAKLLSLLRKWASTYTGRKLGNPVAVSTDLVLAPVKMRDARLTGDETMGCVNVTASPKVRADGQKKSVVELAGGHEVSVEWSLATTRARLSDASCIAAELMSEEDERVFRRLLGGRKQSPCDATRDKEG